MQSRTAAAFLLLAFSIGCSRAPESGADPELAREIDSIRAIDNHAHPVRSTDPNDRDFDALPVDNMEPQTDPVNFRPGNPLTIEAGRALFANNRKQQMIEQKGEQYPAWVLDQMGIEVMLANRVTMGTSIQPPRFRWVAYADALMFPLDNSQLAARNPDRKAFFALEDKLRARYLTEAGLQAVPATLAEYLARVVTPTLERHRQGGAVAEKFEVAYLRPLEFDAADRAAAERIYALKPAPSEDQYKVLQDFLFRYIAAECGRLSMAVHLHTMAGAGGYFDVAGASPLRLEPVLNDPSLRKTNFVMVHGGWPFIREAAAMLQKPNMYLDFSGQSIVLSLQTLAGNLREWLELYPEKVLFATDAYPYSPQMGWEEFGYAATRTGRQALTLALTGMVRDGVITRARASELARMVLRENARKLYGL